MVVGSATGVIPLPGSHRAVAYQPVALPVTPAQSVAGGCADCGTVVMIRTYEVRGDASPIDAAAAAAPGAVAIGQASHRVVVNTRAGQESAALADGSKKRHVYRVTLQMGDGSYRTLSQATEPDFRPGDHARLVQGAIVEAAARPR
jgi:hypothetical protein